MKHKLKIMSAIVLVSTGLDQLTKSLATQYLCSGCQEHNTFAALIRIPQPLSSYWSDTVRLQYAINNGAWGGMFSSLPEPYRALVLVVAVAAFLIGLTYYIHKHIDETWMVVAMSLILSGGLGNWIDRSSVGFVVDFVNMGIGPSFRTNIFNVADVAVMSGAGMWIGYYLLGMDKPKVETESDAPDFVDVTASPE